MKERVNHLKIIKQRRLRGFSLMEVMVALGIIGIVASTVAPVAIRKIDASRISAAHGDISTIQTAIISFTQDNAVPPSLSAGDPDRLPCIRSSEGTLPPMNGASWGSTCLYAHGEMDRHLINNVAGYDDWDPQTSLGWNGPYLNKSPVDPWGRWYFAQVWALWGKTCGGGEPCIGWVVSAGPDEVLETDDSGTEVPVGSDDIAIRME